MKYVKTIRKTCPMCGINHYMRLTEVQEKQWSDYVCYGGLIQDRMPDVDKFGREFIKSGYCPDCQEKLFGSTMKDKSSYISTKEYEEDEDYYELIEQFMDATDEMDAKESILSEAADSLSVAEKVIYLYETGLEDKFYVDDAGKVLMR